MAGAQRTLWAVGSSALFGGFSYGAEIHNALTFWSLFGLEMGNKRFEIVSMFPCDVGFDLPEFLDDFIRHRRILP